MGLCAKGKMCMSIRSVRFGLYCRGGFETGALYARFCVVVLREAGRIKTPISHGQRLYGMGTATNNQNHWSSNRNADWIVLSWRLCQPEIVAMANHAWRGGHLPN